MRTPTTEKFTDRIYQVEQANPGEFVDIMARTPIVLDLEHPQVSGTSYDVVTTIKAGEEEFLLLDFRKAPIISYGGQTGRDPFGQGAQKFSTSFLLVSGNFDPFSDRSAGFKGIRPNSSTTIGRDQYTDRFDYAADDTLSRSHFEVVMDQNGQVSITDLGSTNGTQVFQAETTATQPGQTENTQWTYEDDLSARRAAQEEENARREAERQAMAREAEQRRLSEQRRLQERARQVAELGPDIKSTVESVEGQYMELEVSDIADLVSSIVTARSGDGSDKALYRRLAVELHPDSAHEGESTEAGSVREAKFKLLSTLYEPKSQRFNLP